MQVPVLLVVPAQEPLIESALAAKEGRAPGFSIREARMPEQVRIDDSFSAVPVGISGERFVAMDAIQPLTSRDFAVRAFAEVEAIEAIPEEMEGARVFADPAIDAFPYCAGASQGTHADVAAALKVPQLHAKGLDGEDVAVAIMDTGINLAHLTNKLGQVPRFDPTNSWKGIGNSNSPGRHSVGHGTMCAFDVLIAAPRATLLDCPILTSHVQGGAVAGSTLSVAISAYTHLLNSYAVAFGPGGAHRYKALVINNSWGLYHPSWDFPAGHRGRYCDNPNHPFAAIVNVLIAAGADVVFAAGNCGGDCPDGRCQGRVNGTIMGANAYESVITVAGCTVTNEDRLGYSSQGPSIAGMFQEKPNLTGYSHFTGSEAYGQGSPDSGTSTAAPVVSGCVAALRTRLSHGSHPAASLIAQLEVTARQAPGLAPGWNADYGHGIIDPISAANSLGL